VQRLDGFVSADAPYSGGELKTRPLTFDGNRLVLNVDTDATGFAQVGILGADGQEIDGFGLDDCVYINGDFVDTTVEWREKGTDVSKLAGQPIQIVFRMRGTKLFSFQFLKADHRADGTDRSAKDREATSPNVDKPPAKPRSK